MSIPAQTKAKPLLLDQGPTTLKASTIHFKKTMALFRLSGRRVSQIGSRSEWSGTMKFANAMIQVYPLALYVCEEVIGAGWRVNFSALHGSGGHSI